MYGRVRQCTRCAYTCVLACVRSTSVHTHQRACVGDTGRNCFCFSLSLVVVVVFVFAQGLDEKKYIVLIPLPSLIKNSFVRSFVLSLSLSLSLLAFVGYLKAN